MAIVTVTTAGRLASLQILTGGYVAAGPTAMLLVEDPHSFTADPMTVSDIVADEAVATGYARQAVTFDAPVQAGDGTVTQQSQATSFGLVGGAVDAKLVGCYLFEDSGNDATSPVTACLQFVEEKSTDGTELIVRPVTWSWSPTPF